MASLVSTIYDHVPHHVANLTNDPLQQKVCCKCGRDFDNESYWTAHLAEAINKSFVNVTHIPAGPAAPPQPAEEATEVSISINGELHSVIYAKPRRVKA